MAKSGSDKKKMKKKYRKQWKQAKKDLKKASKSMKKSIKYGLKAAKTLNGILDDFSDEIDSSKSYDAKAIEKLMAVQVTKQQLKKLLLQAQENKSEEVPL